MKVRVLSFFTSNIGSMSMAGKILESRPSFGISETILKRTY